MENVTETKGLQEREEGEVEGGGVGMHCAVTGTVHGKR